MKIGLLFPSIYASPALFSDKIFAPRELLTDLSSGLVDRGHEVTVYSTSDVPTKAKIVSSDITHIQKPLPYFKFRNLDANKRKLLEEEFAKHEFEIDCTMRAFAAVKAKEIDILHCYHDSSLFYGHYMNDIVRDVPVVYTLHDPLPPEGTFEFEELKKFAGHSYISISNAFRRSLPPLNYIETIYHGINLNAFTFEKEAADYVLFMGRLVPDKGLHSAIAAAIATNMRLEIGTQFGGHEGDPYFETKIKPFLANPFIGEPGMVNDIEKVRLYGGAKALLFPIEWEEPFGMVLIEAMACGTPVIAYNRGSVPEIVKDGVTGFIIDQDDAERSGKGTWTIKKQGVEGIIEAMGLISTISRDACRKHIEEHFSAQKMVLDHEACYTKLLSLPAESK